MQTRRPMPPAALPRSNSAGLPNDEPLLSVREVAWLDGCSEKTVRRAIAAGHLAALRIGPGGRLLRITRRAHAAYRSGATL